MAGKIMEIKSEYYQVQSKIQETGERTYHLIEEIINSTTHGIGVILSIIGMVLMIVGIHDGGSSLIVLSASIYGSAMIFLYLASTIYHSVSQFPAVKHVMKIIDHAAIYLFIAGSYTPFALLVVDGWAGWFLFITVWSLAFIGIVQKVFFIYRFEFLAVSLYIGMGWIGILFADQLFDELSFTGMTLLVSGGLAYTVGVVFYILDRIPFMHSIWHIFVMTGSFLHFIVIYRYVLS
jgi:hemolysin III